MTKKFVSGKISKKEHTIKTISLGGPFDYEFELYENNNNPPSYVGTCCYYTDPKLIKLQEIIRKGNFTFVQLLRYNIRWAAL